MLSVPPQHTPRHERLKLFLTQGFFFTQLLGIHADRFDPLAEEAFAGAVLYLDTNILLPRLLQADAGPIFDEMLAVAKQLGIEMRITRATLDETRRVAADRQQQLAKIVDVVPDELMLRVNDEFILAFLERREREQITLDEFFEPFDRLSDLVQHDLGITLIDVVEEMCGDVDVTGISAVIQEEAETVRRRKKSARILAHDVAHFVLIRADRKDHPKTWFLTRDRSVIQAAAKLSRAPEPPLCFSLTGFLQTISPFVTNGNAQHSLADVFSSILSDQLGEKTLTRLKSSWCSPTCTRMYSQHAMRIWCRQSMSYETG